MPIDAKGTLDYLGKVTSGEMIARGDPAFAFRNCASLNCLRHHLNGVKLSSVYTGEMGYRASCGKRRAMRVPYTPGADQVVGTAWPISKNEEQS